jgi:aldehyde dehydrogenase (NAD+)
MKRYPQKLSFMNFLSQLGIQPINSGTSTGTYWYNNSQATFLPSYSPVDAQLIAHAQQTTHIEYEDVVRVAKSAFEQWRLVPAPQRGEIVRQIGQALREHKEALGQLVSYEMGKIYQEGLGEVQEMIDICDFAVGLSRQLYGLSMHSERPAHRMYEQWHPLGIVGIISAFNFPVAVWAWNAMIAAVCGNVCIWKPSEKTPLCAIACQNIIGQVLRENKLPEGIFSVITGDYTAGEWLAKDENINLVSATGSVRMGKKVATTVAARLGKTLLELGGNNAVIITPNANLDLALRAVVFGAVGTCGQRCTTTRRLIVHENLYETVKEKLLKIYKNLPIGNPLEKNILIGPLIDEAAVSNYFEALQKVRQEGGKILIGEKKIDGFLSNCYVAPTIVEAENHYETVQKETFAPILYLIKYTGEVQNAIKLQNSVRQGLSSAIFSVNLLETEQFLSAAGSDCGIANVNIGTSGAEIGGAFGGEKETGGGRESGSDAWKAYMRRQTNTINYSTELPLAQGIQFNI